MSGEKLQSDYEVLGEISRGGMGVVYRARHRKLNREVAIKLMLDDSPDPLAMARFEREAQVLASLDHPNILKAFDYGFHNNAPYLVTALIRGRSLQAILDERKEKGEGWEDEEIEEILIPVARALEYCHHREVYHRDLKPSNIIIDETHGNPILIDFGLSRAKQSEKLSLTGEMLGTPDYMAPEQFEPGGEWGNPGPASDVWAFGVLLYRVILGKLPFQRPSVLNIGRAVMGEPAPDPRVQGPEISEALAILILDCLEKEPLARPSMALLIQRLEDRAQGVAGPRPRSPAILMLVPILLVALAGALAFILRDSSPPIITLLDSPTRAFSRRWTLKGRGDEELKRIRIGAREGRVDKDQFELEIELAAGTNELTIEAEDLAGNIGLKKLSVTLAERLRVGKGGDIESLNEALKAGYTERPIDLLEGTHILSVEISTKLELNGKKGAILQAARGQSIKVSSGGELSLKGLQIEGSLSKVPALEVESGLLSIEDCELRSPADSVIVVTGDKACLAMTRSNLVGAGKSGLSLSKLAKAQLKDCEIRECAENGAQIESGAKLELKHCIIRDIERHGLTALKNAEISLSETKINHIKLTGLSLDQSSSAQVDDCEIQSCSEYGILITGGSDSSVSRSQISETQLHGIHVRGSGRLKALKTQVTQIREGVAIHGDGSQVRMELEEVEVAGTSGSGIVIKFGQAQLTRCKISRSYWPCFDAKGAEVKIIDPDFQGQDHSVIAICDQSKVEIEGGQLFGGEHGILVFGSRSTLSAKRLTIKGGRTDGVHMKDGADNSVNLNDCEISDFGASCAFVTAGQLTMTDCRLLRARYHGVKVDGSARVLLERVKIRDNLQYSLLACNSGLIEIRDVEESNNALGAKADGGRIIQKK